MLQISTPGMESDLRTDFAEEYRNSKLYQCACRTHPNPLMMLGFLLLPRYLRRSSRKFSVPSEDCVISIAVAHFANHFQVLRLQQLLLPQLVPNCTLPM